MINIIAKKNRLRTTNKPRIITFQKMTNYKTESLIIDKLLLVLELQQYLSQKEAKL